MTGAGNLIPSSHCLESRGSRGKKNHSISFRCDGNRRKFQDSLLHPFPHGASFAYAGLKLLQGFLINFIIYFREP